MYPAQNNIGMEHISEQKVQLDNVVLMPSFKYSMEYTIVPHFWKGREFY